MSSGLTISSQRKPMGAFQALPQEIFDTKIIPFLIDPKNPNAFATLNLISKGWRQIMQRDLPYKIVMQNLSGKPSFREEYLNRFPKSVGEKLKVAYEATQKKTSNFEAKLLMPVALSILDYSISILFHYMNGNSAKTPAWVGTLIWAPMVLSNLPADLDLNRCRQNATAKKTFAATGICFIALGMIALAQKSNHIHLCRKSKKIFNLITFPMATMLVGSINFLIQFEGDSLFSKVYRVAKGSLAASVPLAKVARSRFREYIIEPLKPKLKALEVRIFNAVFGGYSLA